MKRILKFLKARKTLIHILVEIVISVVLTIILRKRLVT